MTIDTDAIRLTACCNDRLTCEEMADEIDRLRGENEALHLVNGAADELIQSYKVMLGRSGEETDRLRAALRTCSGCGDRLTCVICGKDADA